MLLVWSQGLVNPDFGRIPLSTYTHAIDAFGGWQHPSQVHDDFKLRIQLVYLT